MHTPKAVAVILVDVVLAYFLGRMDNEDKSYFRLVLLVLAIVGYGIYKFVLKW